MGYRKVMVVGLSVLVLIVPVGCRKKGDAPPKSAQTASTDSRKKAKRRSNESPPSRGGDVARRNVRGAKGQDTQATSVAPPAVSPSVLLLKKKRTGAIHWPQAGPDDRNILIITIDTLRADHLGCYGYFRDTSPNIDEFARSCLLFENCIAPVAQTLPTHTSLFTGVYPREHGITANLAFTRIDNQREGMYKPSPYLFTFAEVLKRAGYTTAAFVSAEPVKKGCGLSLGFDLWHQPEKTETKTARDKVIAPVTLKKVYAWLDQGVDQPFLCWIHLFDPHASYAAPKPYDTMFQTDAALEAYMAQRKISDKSSKPRRADQKPKEWDSRDSINGYDGEIAFTDLHLGKLFDKLRDAGLWDNTAIVLTSDHGEGLGQHQYPEHNEIWQEQLHVPLLMRIPGVKPRRIATQLSIVDVLPTLLGVMGDVAAADIFLQQCTGANVLADDHRPTALYAQHPRTRAGIYANSVVMDGWKYIMYGTNRPSYRKETDKLFNLSNDPFELKDLLAENPDKAAAMKTRLQTMIAEQKGRGRALEAGKIVEVTDENRKALEDRSKNLKALGYMDDDDEE